jgi:monoamine oxidase
MTRTRRQLLGLGIASFLGSLVTGTASGTAQTAGRDLSGRRVIVVGAGLAGLAAAQDLRASGAEVVVFEAGSRVGGRIRTDRSMGVPVEHGAAWIHGPGGGNPISELARSQGAPRFETDDDSLQVFDAAGNELGDAAYARLERMYDGLAYGIETTTAANDPRSLHRAMADLDPDLVDTPLGRWMLSAYFEFDLGADLRQVSAANAFEGNGFAGNDVILPAGYDRLLAPLMAGLDIRLNTPVRRISYAPSGANVDGMAADFVVCAVPLGVMKSGAITFDPPLPAPLRDAVAQIGFGTVTKIALKFDKPFWPTDTQYFGMMTQPQGRWNYWLNYRRFSDHNIQLGFSFGNYAAQADRMRPSEMTRDALKVLRSVWGTAVAHPTQVLTTHWSQDPHFKGAYSFPQTGGTIAQFDRFAQPVAGRLFMAGEHTLFDHHGTTHGALLSGRRAARAIAQA